MSRRVAIERAVGEWMRESSDRAFLAGKIDDLIAYYVDKATDCVYGVCGCIGSADGHCMMCMQPLSAHRLILKSEIQELERRLSEYAKDGGR